MNAHERAEETRRIVNDPAALHAHQHELIDQRVQQYRDAPKGRSGLARYRRRELHKRAFWNVAGHLRQLHGWKGQSVGLGVDDLEAIHRLAHEETT